MLTETKSFHPAGALEAKLGRRDAETRRHIGMRDTMLYFAAACAARARLLRSPTRCCGWLPLSLPSDLLAR